jgi:hypothetical protein
LPIVLVTSLLRALELIDLLAIAGYVALVLYVLAEWPGLSRASRILLWAAMACVALLPVFVPEPLPVLLKAFERAAYYATFMTALSFLREAAASSRLVHRCGYLIINQPPAKRYLTLSTGSALFGIILNIGSINLLGVMTARSNTLRAAGGNPDVQAARKRRMTLALLRGFALTPLVSPFSITLVVVLSSLPGLQWYEVLPLGYLVSALLLGFGWWVDRKTAPRHLSALVPALDRRGNLFPLLQFLALVLAIVGVAIGLELALRIPLVLAILLTAPPMGLLWVAVQYKRLGPRRAMMHALGRFRRQTTVLFPSLRAEVAILGGAGFLGVLLAGMLPMDMMAEAFAAMRLTGPAVAIALVAIVALASQIGLNPIVTVTLLASALPDPQALGLSPALLGLAFMAGWGLAVNSSPMTASVLLLSRLAGTEPATLGYRWNGAFTLGAFLIIALTLLALGVVL